MARTRATTNSSNKAAEVSVDDVGRQLEALREDISALTSTVAALGASQKDAAVAAGSKRVAELADQGREAKAQLANGFDSLRAEAEEMVRGKPIGTVALAAALGLAVGYLTARR